MRKLKQYFDTPKKAAVSSLILVATLLCLGTGTVLATNAIAQSTAIGAEKAQYFACADAGVDPTEAQMLQSEFDFERGQFIYEVEFIADGTEYSYWVKASDGTIVKKEAELLFAQNGAEGTGQQLTLEEAKAVALSDAGLTEDQVRFTEEKLEQDDGVTLYELDFKTDSVKYDYEINAATGHIYSKSKETFAQSTLQETTPQEPVSQEPSGQTSSDPGSSTQQQTTQTSGQVDLATAKATALADAGVSADAATFTKEKLDHDDGMTVYEIEFYTATHEYDYEINAATGAVYQKSVEAFYAAAIQDGASVESVDQAKAIAVAQAGLGVGDVTFLKAKLDHDDGMMVYEIEFYYNAVEYECKINAANGAVLEFDYDLDD